MITIQQVTKEEKEDGTMDVTVDYMDGLNSVSVTQNFYNIPKYNYIVSLRPSSRDIYLVDINDQMLIGDLVAETVLRV